MIIGGVFTFMGVIFIVVALPLFFAFRVTSFMDNGVSFVPYLFLLLGTGFLVAGITVLARCRREKAEDEKLIRNGYYVLADVTDVYQDTHVTVNGSSPYVVECRFIEPGTGEIFIFHSPYLWTYPEKIFETQLVVYVDPDNMDHYYVDIENSEN